MQPRRHIVGLGSVQRLERLVDKLLVDLVREILLQGAPVEGPLAGARQEAYPDNSLLAPTGGARVALGVGHDSHVVCPFLVRWPAA